jgi:hypothetical protein
MSHPTTLRHAVWDALRTFYRDFRRVVASGEEHAGQALVVPEGVDTIEAALGRQFFSPNWEFSYHERGEDLNLARVVYDRRRVGHHEYVWWQTHVRGWEQGDGSVRLRPHYELEPTEYDQDHIAGIGVDIDLGIDHVAAALDDEGLSYVRHEDLPAGGHD